MSERPATPDEAEAMPDEGVAAPPAPPKRSPGHRGQDVRDTVAELAARAHEISLEAGSKMTSALRDVIGAAAGLTTFAVESARDLVQYFVRRGQMTQDEADKLIRQAEEAALKKPKPAPPKAEAPKRGGSEPAAKAAKSTPHAKDKAPPAKKADAKKPDAKKADAKKPAAKKPEPKKAEAKKASAKKPSRK